MALGLLGFLFLALTGLTIVSIIILFVKKGKFGNNNTVFISIMVFALILAWMTFTALPSNYIFMKVIAAMWGVLALVSLAVKYNVKNNTLIARVLLSISIVGCLYQMFFV